MNSTILPEEVEKFSRIAAEWWDTSGKFRPLHLFNPVRISYIRQKVVAHFGLDDKMAKPFENLDFLDIGCGGGLLSEPMTRLGANLTGADASEKNIKTAMTHAQEQGLDIDYRAITAEALAQERPESYDVILNMEVIEHVSDPDLFISECAKLLKPGGIMFVATLNRTVKSYGLAIVGAEYILRWLPVGTHDWDKFLKPIEIENMGKDANLRHQEWQGVSFNPLTNKWRQTDDLSVNYMGIFKK